MDNEKFVIRSVLLYEFKKGTSGAETFRSVTAVFGEACISERQCRWWFERFRSGNLSLADEPRSGRPSDFDSDRLRQIVEHDSSITVRELAIDFGVHYSTIDRHLIQMGFTSKLNRWVPHRLSAQQKMARLTTCASLLARQKSEPFLDRIVTCDEKWCFYDNEVRGRSWCAPGVAPQAAPKQPTHSKKTMLCVWWDSVGIIHFEFLPTGQTINTALYCEQLHRVHAALLEKRPYLINRKGVIFHQDNARPHISRPTIDKILSFDWEIMQHPAYSPDIAPSDYHLFRSLQNSMNGIRFTNRADVEAHVTAFLASKPQEFFRKGIQKLVENWEKVVTSDGEYFLI